MTKISFLELEDVVEPVCGRRGEEEKLEESGWSVKARLSLSLSLSLSLGVSKL